MCKFHEGFIINVMKFSKAVKHLEKLGFTVGTVAYMTASPRRAEKKSRRVPVIVAKNGALPKRLREMIRQSRAQSNDSN